MRNNYICNSREFDVNQDGVQKFIILCTNGLSKVSSKKDKDELQGELDIAVLKATLEIENNDQTGLYDSCDILCKLLKKIQDTTTKGKASKLLVPTGVSEKIDDTITKGKASKLLVPTGVFGVGVLTFAGMRHLYKKWRNKSEKAIVAKEELAKAKEELEKAKEELEKAKAEKAKEELEKAKAVELEKAKAEKAKAVELEKAKAVELEKAIEAANLNLDLPNLTQPMTKEQKKSFLTEFLLHSLKKPKTGVLGGMRKKKPFVSKKKKFQKNNK